MSLLLPPILYTMATDRRLRPRDIDVWIVATHQLDFVEYRPLKALTVAVPLRISQSHASKALRRLVLCRYLDRQRQVGGVDPTRVGPDFQTTRGAVIPGGGTSLYRIPHSVVRPQPPGRAPESAP